MKTAFLFLGFLVVASAKLLGGSVSQTGTVGSTFETAYGSIYGSKNEKIADKELLVRNKNILRLLNHVTSLNTNEDQRAIAKEYRIEANVGRYTRPEAAVDFVRNYKIGMLPKNNVFTITNDKHRDEVIRLFHVLYYARDFETFYKTACWARDNVNEGMFVYALTVAVIHRHDTKGITLPSPSEINPFLFVNTEVVNKAQVAKMHERVQDTKLAESNGVRQVDNTFYIRSNYSGWYTQTNDETTLTYFTEDIGLNNYYYYFHAVYPFWMDGEELSVPKNRRGELFLYTHQQILARYYMERLSNNLGEIPRFKLDRPIKTGFKSSLRHHNGLVFPSRPNDFLVDTEDNLWDVVTVKDYERRIRKAIDEGFVYTEDGRILSLRKPEDIERLGNLIQCNKDSPNSRYYLLGLLTAKKLLGNGDDTVDDYMTNPAVLEKYETALRDPLFYQLAQRVTHNTLRFKETLQPYTRDELTFPGVKVEDVTTDKLVTFFDLVELDITNVVSRKPEEMDKNREQQIFKAVQRRLNHSPFNVKIDINSDKSTESVIRIFLGPKYDSMHRRMHLDDNRVNFFELDRFVYKLKTGRNVVTRHSREFWATVEDRTPARELLKKITTCINGNEQCLVDTTTTVSGFPDRLALPKGKRGGMSFLIYVVITPLHEGRTYGLADSDVTGKTTNKATTVRINDLSHNFDDNAFGYPLDRPIDSKSFWNPNMIMKEVIIFHKAGITNNLTERDSDLDTDSTNTDTTSHRDFNRDTVDARDTDSTHSRDTIYRNTDSSESLESDNNNRW